MSTNVIESVNVFSAAENTHVAAVHWRAHTRRLATAKMSPQNSCYKKLWQREVA